MMAYFISKNKQIDNLLNKREYTIKSLNDYDLVYEILYHNKSLVKIINKHLNNVEIESATIDLYNYIITIDILSYNIKKIYNLDNESTKKIISEYLLKNNITKFNITIYHRLSIEDYTYISTEICNDIFYNKIIEQLNQFPHIQKFLIKTKNKYKFLRLQSSIKFNNTQKPRCKMRG